MKARSNPGFSFFEPEPYMKAHPAACLKENFDDRL